MASTSAWCWSDEHSLYFNPATQQWAAPQPDGTWKYSDAAAHPSEARAAVEAEEGEDVDGIAIPPEQIWPSDSDPDDPFSKVPLLRLVLLTSTIIRPPLSVALVDPADGLSLGRDRTFEKRIRLPELLVSKSHATVFWMQAGLDKHFMRDGGWAVVDNGSTHGTWIREPRGESVRLSPPKVASAPKELKHLDIISIGSTSFAVHLHASLACSACSVTADETNIIPLNATTSTSTSGTTDVTPSTSSSFTKTRTKAEKEIDRRAQMRGLKDKYLAPSGSGGGSIGSRKKAAQLVENTAKLPGNSAAAPVLDSPKFVDRAAARRALTGAAAKPPVAQPSPFFAIPGRGSSSASTVMAAPSPIVPPENPFGTTSRGAQLLSKLTRTESVDGAGLGTLIQPRTFDTTTTGREQRPGLGSKQLVVIGQPKPGEGAEGNGGKRGWREDVREANRKRFKELEGGR
ncbi:hypothetical protein P7C70_g6506, partial [Phenoliferia sp. Uapishka_3]